MIAESFVHLLSNLFMYYYKIFQVIDVNID